MRKLSTWKINNSILPVLFCIFIFFLLLGIKIGSLIAQNYINVDTRYIKQQEQLLMEKLSEKVKNKVLL